VAANRLLRDHRIVGLSRLSTRLSVAYVLAVAVVVTVGYFVSPVGGQFAGWLLTLGPGTLVLGFLYFFAVPLLDLAGFPVEGPFGPAVVVLGHVGAAMVNVVLVSGLMTLCRDLRDCRRSARARAGGAST